MQSTLQIFEPVTFGGTTCEFRFDKAVYKNPRLVNLGMKSSSGDGHYPSSIGALALIKNLSVYNGAQLINQVKGLDNLSSYLSFAHNNADNYSFYSEKVKNLLGFSIDTKIKLPDDPTYLAIDTLGSGTASFDLADYLPFFAGLDLELIQDVAQMGKDGKKMSDIKKYVTNNAFVRGDALDLRVVIEWNPPIVVDGSGSYTILRPLIVADKMPLDLQLPKDFTVFYYNWDNESVNIPVAANGETQQVSYKLQAFNNKTLGKLAYISQLTDSDEYNEAMLKYCSKAMYKEIINFDFQGLIISQKGINSPARKLQYLTYADPSFVTPVTSNNWLMFSSTKIFDDDGIANEVCSGNLSFGCLDFMKQRINNDLTFYYQRTGNTLADYPFASAFNMLFYGQTERVLQCKSGNVLVSN